MLSGSQFVRIAAAFVRKARGYLRQVLCPLCLSRHCIKPLNYRASVLLGSPLGNFCPCGCWFPKIDVDFHCVYSVKTATAACGRVSAQGFLSCLHLAQTHENVQNIRNHHNVSTSNTIVIIKGRAAHVVIKSIVVKQVGLSQGCSCYPL